MDELLKGLNKRVLRVELEDIGSRITRQCKICVRDVPLHKLKSHAESHNPSTRVRKLEPNGLSPRRHLVTCKLCWQVFSKESSLQAHKAERHGIGLTRKRAQSFPTVPDQVPPEVTRPKLLRRAYPCSFCDKTFISPSQCKSHENAQHGGSVRSNSAELEVKAELCVDPKELDVKSELCVDPKELEVKAELCVDPKELDVKSELCVDPKELEVKAELCVDPSKLEVKAAELVETDSSHCDEGSEAEVTRESNVKVECCENKESDELDEKVAELEVKETPEPSLGKGSAVIPPADLDLSFGPSPLSLLQKMDFEHERNGLERAGLVHPSLPYSNHLTESSYNCSSMDGSSLLEPPKLTSIGVMSCIPRPEDRKPFSGPGLPNGETNPSIITSGDSRTCLHCYAEIQLPDLFAHIKAHLKKGQKECSLCTYRAIASGDLRDHMNKHYNIKPYTCPICGNSYGWQSGFKKHVQSHERDKKAFKCSHCKLRFDTQRERRRHELVHVKDIAGPVGGKKGGGRWPSPAPAPQEEQPYVPQEPDYSQHYAQQGGAGQAYAQQGSLCPYGQGPAYDFGGAYPAHQVYHQQQAEYGQAESSWTLHNFDAGSSYNNSLPGTSGEAVLQWNDGAQSHSTPPAHPEPHFGPQTTEPATDEAGKIFSEPEDLRESETCKTCGLEIGMPELPAHIESHIGPSQKSCGICKYKCHTGKYLLEHYNIHYNLKPFICPVCSRGFAMKSYLRSHTQQVHESEKTRRFQCRYCPKRFVRPAHQRSHEKIHEGHGEKLPPAVKADPPNSDSSNSLSRHFSESNSGSSPASHQHSNSPNLVNLAPAWPNQAGPSGGWAGGASYNWATNDPYVPPYVAPAYDSWPPSPYLIKADVNWTAPNVAGHSWAPPFQPAPIKTEAGGWFEPAPPPPPPAPSASVQDLWAELHYDELKLFPETANTDGISIITELSPLDVPPLILPDLTLAVPLDTPDLAALGEAPQVMANPALLHSAPGINWKPQGRASGKAKTRVTAEARHRMNQVRGSTETEVQTIPLASGEPVDDDDDEGPITCQTCGVQVPAAQLLNHIHGHLVPGQRTCTLCDRTYCNYVTLREHVHVHYDLKPHKCSYCPKRFNTKYSLKSHEAFDHDKGGGLSCAHCQKTFALKSDLQKHLRTHGENGMVLPRGKGVPGQVKERRPTAEKLRAEAIAEVMSRVWEVRVEDVGSRLRKKCPICSEEILLRDFFEHKYGHEEPCYVCQKPVLLTEILYHGPTHVGPTMTCEVCGWKAKQRSQLWEHLNGHNKQKPLRCMYCGVGFASRNSVRSHYLALHTKFRPHSCRYCSRTFVQINSLKQHELTHFHSTCPVCFKKFELKKELHLHMRQEHKENLKASP